MQLAVTQNQVPGNSRMLVRKGMSRCPEFAPARACLRGNRGTRDMRVVVNGSVFFYPPEGKFLPLGENILITKDKILESLPLELSNLSDLEASMIHFDTKILQIAENLPLGEK